MPRYVYAGGGPVAPLLAGQARAAGWTPVAVAGPSPGPIADELGVPVVPLDELLNSTSTDVAVVDTAADVRAHHAATLLARGVHVLLAPGLTVADAELVVDAERASSATLAVADIFPTAPAVQRWFAELGRCREVSHLSGRAAFTDGRPEAPGLDWPLIGVAVLSARLAGWGDPTVATADGRSAVLSFSATAAVARLEIDRSVDPVTAPRWELQAADPTTALRVEMVPVPRVERNGDEIALPRSSGPAESFGAAGFLRAFWADVTTGRRPVLDATFGLQVDRLRAVSRAE